MTPFDPSARHKQFSYLETKASAVIVCHWITLVKVEIICRFVYLEAWNATLSHKFKDKKSNIR